jgi:hypothetical protein
MMVALAKRYPAPRPVEVVTLLGKGSNEPGDGARSCERAFSRAREDLLSKILAVSDECEDSRPPCRLVPPRASDYVVRNHKFEPLERIGAALDDGRFAYFFDGDRYTCWDKETDAVCDDREYPAIIVDKWPGVTFPRIDAAVNYGDGRLFFFSGNQYVRFDIARGRTADGYPKAINETTWPGVAGPVQSAVAHGGALYFFSGNRYTRFNPDTGRAAEGYPRDTASHWPGLTFSKIEASIRSRDGRYIYFFSGDQYVRYNLEANRVDPGYPASVSQYWNGLLGGGR